MIQYKHIFGTTAVRGKTELQFDIRAGCEGVEMSNRH